MCSTNDSIDKHNVVEYFRALATENNVGTNWRAALNEALPALDALTQDLHEAWQVQIDQQNEITDLNGRLDAATKDYFTLVDAKNGLAEELRRTQANLGMAEGGRNVAEEHNFSLLRNNTFSVRVLADALGVKRKCLLRHLWDLKVNCNIDTILDKEVVLSILPRLMSNTRSTVRP